MATVANTNLVAFSMDTVAKFRAWTTAIHSVFTQPSTWVNTADTGQADLTTITLPTVAYGFSGYKVYRMNDSLQATKPVFIRIDFGCSAQTTAPSVKVTIGTGSDGAGTITGVLHQSVIASAAISNSGPDVLYGSVASNRVGFYILGQSYTTGAYMWFSIERSKNAQGQDTTDGLIVAGGSSLTGSYVVINSMNALSRTMSHYIPFTGLSTPEPGLHFVMPYAAQSVNNGIGQSVMLPLWNGVKNPGNNIMILGMAYQPHGTVTIQLYGTAHTFLVTRATNPRGLYGSSLDNSLYIAMLYE